MPFSLKRRRWLSFSLRGLFIAVTLLCVWLAIVSNSARKQRAVVQWVTEHHGKGVVRLADDARRGHHCWL